MRSWLVLPACLLAAACAGPQPLAPRLDHLFHDELFAAPTERVSAAEIFALSEPMKRYLQHDIAGQLRRKGPVRGLLEAVSEKGQLKIEYDTSLTRTAQQAFEAKAGNCLSLVIMTAALAKELGLQVRFQSAYLEEAFSRNSNLLLRSGHVNLSLDRGFIDRRMHPFENALTIDFLPPEDLRGLRVRDIAEETVIAMFMNNRAVEALVEDRLDDAYWWAREAVRSSPAFLGAQNTLGVVYLRRQQPTHAAAVFSHVLGQEADNKPALSNLARTYARLGHTEASLALYRRLAQLEPDPPFSFFNEGLAAMKKQDFGRARDLFAKEVARADYHAEFHFWLGLANLQLGDVERARKHLRLALDNSTTPQDRAIYSAKLDWLRANGLKN